MSATIKKGAGKDKRNKIILVALVGVLGVILVIQGPTLLSAFGGGSSDEQAAAESGEGETTGAAAVEVALPQPVQLPNSDIPQAAGSDELATISRFSQSFSGFDPLLVEVSSDEGTGSDPTDDQPTGDAPTGDTGPGLTGELRDRGSSAEPTAPDDDGSGSGADAGAGSSGSGGDTGTPDASPEGGIFTSGSGAVASLSINGITEDIVVGASFPSSNPVFKLVMIDGDAISVGLVNGAFSTGTTTIDVELGESRTLVSQPDGTRYRVKFISRPGR
ncbi:MAG: hypothetical protein OEM67_01375 [Thermoleophilia bacterium]|nr:hypothetical protein [Thermoleophilia bacterium]MDH3725214.1 hypothetical protein [Thermoleophilia bacterium]